MKKEVLMSLQKNESYIYKIASEDWEFEQIHTLNYKTFAQEIPQHSPNPSCILEDTFHKENTYIICCSSQKLLGMVAVRGDRPFSLDKKLADLDFYLPQGRSVCEVRLLSIDREHRRGVIIKGMIDLLFKYCRSKGYDLAVISGTTRQLKLYRHFGFVPFGPMVGTPDAMYQPMYLTLETFEKSLEGVIENASLFQSLAKTVNLLPGPVAIRSEVKDSFCTEPISHRSSDFIRYFNKIKKNLSRLVNAREVEILLGSGTLANDAIAGQLSLSGGKGIVLSNGEFGERLIDHASRFRLNFISIKKQWGELFCEDELTEIIKRDHIQWMWAVHCETSTGMLNDSIMFKNLSLKMGIRLCLDCISSIGTVPVDLEDVFLASCVSGKALGSYPGLSMVFYNHKIYPSGCLPRYLDLGYYASQAGIPFTHSSNLILALDSAIKSFNTEKNFKRLSALSLYLRRELETLGLRITTPLEYSSPAVLNIELPSYIKSFELGHLLEENGFILSYMSEYLRKRNWIQICIMGDMQGESIKNLFIVLEKNIKNKITSSASKGKGGGEDAE